MLQLKEVVEQQGGINLKVSNWGRKKLAWERKKYQRGLYVHHTYLAQTGVVNELERSLGINENVLLRQTILLARNVNPADRTAQEDRIGNPRGKGKERAAQIRKLF